MNFDDKKILILQGISGSGKSTFAKKLYGSNPTKWEIVSRDLTREELLGKENLEKYFAQGQNFAVEEEVTKREHLSIASALKRGKSVIIDNTNLKKKYVSEYCKIAIDMGLSFEDIATKRFETDVDTACQRVTERNERIVPREVIQRQYDTIRNVGDIIDEQFWDSLLNEYKPRQWFLPPFNIEPITADKTLPKAIICDLDGTLAHRSLNTNGYISYRSFYDYDKCDTDEVDSLVADVVKGLHQQGYTIIFVSGRKSECMQLTRNFIQKATGLDESEYWLFMRDENKDVRVNQKTGRIEDDSDDIVKYRLFNQYIRNNFDVIGAIDDRKRVVAVWEQLGLRVLNVGLLNENF